MAKGGTCLCGAVAFEMTGVPRIAAYCHCSRCRKTRGTAHATNLVVSLDGVRYLRGRELLSSYKVPEARSYGHVFCQVCGSSMPRFDEGRGVAIIPMGSFDDDPGVKPNQHIFVASKAPWEDITDDLPQHPGPPAALWTEAP